MVSEALDGLTDEQLADLELQESGLVSGQSDGTIASTPFAQRINPQPAVESQTQPEPAALSDYELNKLEEENYRRVDYVMTPEEFDQYWDRREKEDREVGRFIEGLGQGAAGLVGVVPKAGRELRDAAVGMVTDPVNQVQRNVQTGAEIVRKAGINLVQLYDWVGGKVDDLATSSKRAEAINAGIMDRLIAEGKMTGDRERDMQIYQAALAEARKSGAYTPTAEQVREDRQTAYQRYVREKSLERDYAAVSQFKTGESQMSSPTTAETYQITDEKPMETVSQLGAMAIDPVNLIPMGAGALSKARVLRRMAVLSEKPLLGVERAASGLADVAERIETGLSTRIQDITGLTQKQQAALGAGVAGTAVYVDSATESQGGLTKAVMMVGGVLPALHYGGGLLRKVGSAAGGASTVVREAGVGGLGVARAEAAAGLAGNAAIPERYRKFFTGYVDGTDSTLKRVAQNSDNPEALRRVSRFADRMGATQVARVADDAVSGAVTAGIVGTPFAALQPDAERAGEVMGGILALGAAGGVAGGFARRRSPEVVDADIARMFADVQASGGNVEAFSRLPHQTLDRLSAMQGVLAGKVDFIPLSGDEYRMNADIAQNAGETTAGVFVDKDANNRARVFINLDAKTKTEYIAPHEIGHAILTSDILDGQPRADLRNLVNQQYGPEGVVARGREYIGRLIDGDARAKTTGEMPTVLTEAEMAAVDGGKTMDDVVADRMKDPAERERLINERFEEFSQRSIDKGQDPLDWARDEIIAETFASDAPAIDFRAIRRDAMFPRLAESMLSAGGRVLEMFGANLSSTGRLLDNPSVLFRDNPLFQDRIMQKRVREYIRSYDQFLAGLEEAGSAAPKGVELARSNNPADLGRSTHVKLRDEGRGVLENDFLFQKPDGTYSFKPQKLINQTEASRAAQIKTLYDARKFVPVNSTEFGKRKVNGRETIGGPVLPPQFDLFTHFPQHLRPNKQTGELGLVRSFEASREDGGTYYVDYNRIGSGASGRYRVLNFGNVRAIQTEMGHLGWLISKANHLLAVIMDINAFRASAMKAINRGELGIFNNEMRQVEADLKTYLLNHKSGLPGEAGIGQAKRDMLNGLIGTGTAVQREANPIYAPLNPRGSIRTFRVDRINDAQPTGRTGYFFDYDKINNNRMPQALPREAMGMPDGAVGPREATVTEDGLVQAPEDAPKFKLPRRAMAQFMPDTGVDLADYADRTILALPADRMGIGSMMVGPKGKEREVSVKGQGGAGFMEIYNGGGWAFSDEATGNRFMKRLREAAEPGESSVLVGITAMSEFNHLKNQTGQLAYVEALEAAIAGKSISKKQADAHIKAISQSIVQSTAKSVTDSTRRKFAAIKNLNDFAKAVRNKSLNFADAAPYSVQISRRALPIPYKEAKDIGIAFDDIGKQTADPRYADVPFGTVVALLEVPLDQAPVRSDFHYSYPFKVTGRSIGFLKQYYDVGQLTSDPRIRNSAGAVQAQPLQTVLPKLDQTRKVTRGQAMPDIADAPPFYLKSSQAIDAKVQGKAATPDQLKAILTNPQNGIKAEELKWTGVMQEVERLAKENNGKVPKDALLRYLAEDGAVRLEEVTLGQAARETRMRNQAREDLVNNGIANPTEAQITTQLEEFWPEYDDGGRDIGGTKYSQYQLPGGENYREVVLAMPANEAMPYKQWLESQGIDDAAIDAMPRYDREQLIRRHSDLINQAFNENYRSTHFDTPNYVAHMRLNDRVDAKGKQGLFIEELQSDRHQAGREHGYKEPFEQWIAFYDAGGTEVPIGYGRSEKQALESIDKNWEGLVKIQTRKRDGVEGVIPDAPFRTSWPLQLFKRALRDAVADGKDWIGWTTGETQAARYDLSKQAKALLYKKRYNGYYIDIMGRNRNDNWRQIAAGVAPEKLSEVVGKEIADRILAGEGQDIGGGSILRGVDLKVGGEGMKGFYDTMVPKDVAKYVKQWGGQVEKSNISQRVTATQEDIDLVRSVGMRVPKKVPATVETPIWRVNITPQMREGIKKAGQALFAAGSAAVVADQEQE